MKLKDSSFLLYAITEDNLSGVQLNEKVNLALKGGITLLQYRNKNSSKEKLLEDAAMLKELCHSHNVPLIINDNVDVALSIDADGVHLGQGDMPIKDARKILGEGKIIGASAHNVEEAIFAERSGADYIGVGAVFSTSTKSDTIPLSLEMLRKISRSVNIPIVAIGGITKDNMNELRGSGISGVALVSAIFSANDIESECKELLKQSKNIRQEEK